ncbi:centrosome-associated protein CEP250-like [Mytilus trossulus]|uniref:centrosome-associated protein CEP250-like n=1 Tax=Mytilus trossulus TaxID=6551 RepID=UPI0030075E4B
MLYMPVTTIELVVQRCMGAKLAKRRTKIAEIRQKREDELLSKSKMNKDEFDKLTKQLEAELAAEEVKIEMERQQALIDFKRKMASETEALLVEQEKELGVLIGRLEIGAARRQALLIKQDTQLQSLQDHLEKKLTDGTVKTSAVNQILQQHKNQMEYVHDQIENKREHQIQVIQDKIQTKKLMKEQELQEEKHEERETVKSASIKRRGAG